jgi:hydroxypyruvate isomerase
MAPTSIKFAANLGFLFQEVPLLQRFAAAKAAGFDAVELAFEQYDHPVEEVAQALKAAQLTCALINTPKGMALALHIPLSSNLTIS